MTRRSISARALDRLIRSLPGYDPFDDSEGFWFDAASARKAIRFFTDCLTHVKGKLAGQPFELAGWEKAIVANIFGWKDDEGLRRYRAGLIYVPRKNGKTAFTAGLLCLVMFTDGEPGGEIYCAAADTGQAALVGQHVRGMIRNEPALNKRAKIYLHAITYPAENTTFKTVSSTASTKHGYNPHMVVVDELHAQKNRDLVDALETAMGAREQPLMLHITTADFSRESICNEVHDYAGKVRDGIIPDARFLPVIYEASIEDDWTDPAVWYRANPNLGVSLSLQYIEDKCKKAQESPAFENTFKRLHLNIKTEQDVRWLRMANWDACDTVLPDLKGRSCYAGMDLSSTRDISGLTMLFPPIEDDPLWYILPVFWVPGESMVERERRDRVPYPVWEREGLIEKTHGDVIDYDYIRKKVNELGEIYDIKEIAVDRWGATQIIGQLAGDGFEMVPFGQGFASMAAPTLEFERLVNSKLFAHGGHPVMRWMASNVSVEMDAPGNMKPSKKKSSEKIDGIVMTIMALGRAIVADETESPYDTRGLIVLG